MPTFHSLLPPTGNSTDLATYVTDTIDPLPNRLILVRINCYIAAGSVQPPTPTVTGNGITYTLEKSQPIDATGTDQSTLFVFRGMSSAPTKGAITIAFGSVMGNCAWSIDQSSADVDTSGTNGSGAIAQASVGATSGGTVTTSPTCDYGSAMTAGNTAYFVSAIETNGPQTPRAGWVETGDSSATALVGMQAQYYNAGTDTGGSATWSTAARAGCILLEIKAGATSPNGLVAARASSATGSVNTLPGVAHTTPILNDIEILAHASDATQTLAIDGLFTQLLNLVDGSLRAYLGWNVSDGTETGDVSISSTATANRQVGALATFRGYTGIADTASLAETGTDTAHTSPTYTPINTGSLVGFVYLERTSSSTVAPVAPPGGLTKAVEFGTSGSGGTYVQIAYKDTGVVAGVDESPGDWTSLVAAGSVYVFAFELTPAATDVTGALDGTLPAITADLAGTARVSGTLAGNLPSLTGSLSATARASGSLTGNLPALTGAATASVKASATIDAALPALTGAITGTATVAGSAVATLPALTGALTGDVASPVTPVTGTISASLPAMQGAITAVIGTGVMLFGRIRPNQVAGAVRDNQVHGDVRSNQVTGDIRSNQILGGNSVARTLSPGSVEDIWAEVTFLGLTASEISAVTAQIAFTTTDTPPTSWQAADSTTREDITGAAKLSVSKSVTADLQPGETSSTYRVWAKLSDGTIVPCEQYTVR